MRMFLVGKSQVYSMLEDRRLRHRLGMTLRGINGSRISMPRTPRAEIDQRIDALHGERLRVWSIVITFFGDSVVPRGGEVWLGVVSALMERLRINAGTLGAAMSRLTAEDWLVRFKRGRRSHYRLAEPGRQAFNEAARRIYDLDRSRWTGEWTVWVMPEVDGALAQAWLREGFGQLGPGVFIRPEERPERSLPPIPAGATRLDARAGRPTSATVLAERAYPVEAAEAGNRAFLRAYQPLLEALERSPDLTPDDAIAARTLLIHDYRRISLREPALPPAAIPDGSARLEARHVVGAIYRQLLEASEQWLDAQPESALGRPHPAFFERFGGLHEGPSGQRPGLDDAG